MARSVCCLHRLSLVVERGLGGGGVERYIRLVVVREGINLGQRGRRLAHVELASHDVGDETRSVLAEEVDFTAREFDRSPLCLRFILQKSNNVLLLLRRRAKDFYAQKFFRIQP